jgi:hypothetical protein
MIVLLKDSPTPKENELFGDEPQIDEGKQH